MLWEISEDYQRLGNSGFSCLSASSIKIWQLPGETVHPVKDQFGLVPEFGCYIGDSTQRKSWQKPKSPNLIPFDLLAIHSQGTFRTNIYQRDPVDGWSFKPLRRMTHFPPSPRSQLGLMSFSGPGISLMIICPAVLRILAPWRVRMNAPQALRILAPRGLIMPSILKADDSSFLGI